MNNSFELEILTPKGSIYKDLAKSIIIDTPTGKLGIQKDYENSVISLKEGKIEIKEKNKKFLNSFGFVTVFDNKVTIFAIEAFEEKNIDDYNETKENERIKEFHERKVSNENHIKMQSMISKMINQLKRDL